MVPWRFVPAGEPDLASRASRVAAELGLPVALKIVSPQIEHKTDVGGVVLGLESEDEVARAVVKMVQDLGVEAGRPPGPSGDPGRRTLDGVLLQQMAPSGTETIVGITRIPRVGPLVMFGLGGIYVEALRDVVLRLCPLDDIDADQMIREVRLSSLLGGLRGQAPRDRRAIAEVVSRMSQLAVRHPRVAEMDINPLLALEHGVVAVDTRIQLSPESDDDTSG